MSGYESRPGDVTIYKEKDKKNERGPDWKGFALVQIPDDARPGDVVKMEIAVWNKGNYGTMLGGSIKPPMQRTGGGGGSDDFRGEADRGFSGRAGNNPRQAGSDPFGDDVPFLRW